LFPGLSPAGRPSLLLLSVNGRPFFAFSPLLVLRRRPGVAAPLAWRRSFGQPLGAVTSLSSVFFFHVCPECCAVKGNLSPFFDLAVVGIYLPSSFFSFFRLLFPFPFLLITAPLWFPPLRGGASPPRFSGPCVPSFPFFPPLASPGYCFFCFFYDCFDFLFYIP